MCKRNRAIHIVFVPVIFWSFLVFVAKIPLIVLFDSFPVNVSFALTFAYVFYYVLLEPIAGTIFAPVLLTAAYSANLFVLTESRAATVAGVMQVVGWSLQMFGHLVLERRLPAFFDNVIQAFLLAPLFVFMEVLFLVGYRPALKKRVAERIQAKTAASTEHSKSD